MNQQIQRWKMIFLAYFGRINDSRSQKKHTKILNWYAKKLSYTQLKFL